MPKSILYETLRVLFRNPIVILMLGDWRTGKTDTSLLMAHYAKKHGLIDKIGSNIYTYDNPEVEYIISLSHLIKWLHADKKVKLFIFDEALKHIYRRKAMSQKNVDIITEVLPELSKGHGRIILCTQIEKIDSDVLHPAFCRAEWKKLNKKTMLCVSKHHPPRTFRNLPRSPIRFDKDRSAKFIIDKKVSKLADLAQRGKTYEICGYYAKNWSFRQIQSETGYHPEEIKRAIRKGLEWFIQNSGA